MLRNIPPHSSQTRPVGDSIRSPHSKHSYSSPSETVESGRIQSLLVAEPHGSLPKTHYILNRRNAGTVDERSVLAGRSLCSLGELALDVHGDVAVFDRFAWIYDRLMPSADAESLAAGLARAERDVERVVDVAGGSGRGVRAVDVADRIVVDAARGMLTQARRHGLVALQGDAARLPIRDGSADAVTIVDAFHHLPDRDGAVRAAARVLAPGGVLVVADFDPATLRGRGLVAAERLVGFESRFDTPERLCERLSDAGLSPAVVEAGFGFVVAGVRP